MPGIVEAQTAVWNDEQRDRGYADWKKAVQRTLDWVDFD
jgi:glycerol kinase